MVWVLLMKVLRGVPYHIKVDNFHTYILVVFIFQDAEDAPPAEGLLMKHMERWKQVRQRLELKTHFQYGLDKLILLLSSLSSYIEHNRL